MNHAVLGKSLWKRTCAVNRTLDFFHPPSTLQSKTNIFNFRSLLYTVEVTAYAILEIKVDPTSTETTYSFISLFNKTETTYSFISLFNKTVYILI